MNTVSGFGALDTRPLGPASGPADVVARSLAGADIGSRWLDGLDSPGAARLGVELTPASMGLGATEHAQRVLACLVGDASA